MSAGRYLFCWFAVGCVGGTIYTEQWPWVAINAGMFFLVIADAIVGALKERGRK